MRIACFIAVLVMFAAPATFAQDRPRRQPPPLQDAIARLTAEAERAWKDQRLPSEQPDFIRRFDRTLDPDEVSRAIIGRMHNDPFTDAYIRWQLTSAAVNLHSLSAAEFNRLLREAPPLLENPRATEEILALMARAANAGPLATSDRDRLREVVADLDKRTAIVEALNVPAINFRAWVQTQLIGGAAAALGNGAHLHWLIENCAATIDAGWPPASIKRRTAAAFTAAGYDDSLTSADRAAVAEVMERLAGRERRSVNKVTFMADGSVRVTYSNAAVTRRDATNWRERLAGNVPQ